MVHRKMWNSASLKFCQDQSCLIKWQSEKTTTTKHRSNETLQSTHNTKGRPVHDDLWWGKWLTYQSVLPILLLTRCSGTLSESCLICSNWYGCILVGLLEASASSSELELAILYDCPEWCSVHMCIWFWRHGNAFGTTENAFFRALITLGSQFHLHHHSQWALMEIVSKITPNLRLVL